uniref:PDZ domain-containing protein n=1 Tax=Zooxanthella nutricula TaxID=1333877 RepID=A0A7S2LY13_9DINO
MFCCCESRPTDAESVTADVVKHVQSPPMPDPGPGLPQTVRLPIEAAQASSGQENPQEAPKVQGDREFEIKLVREGEPYGIAIKAKLERVALRIALIKDEGLIPAWNAANPNNKARVDDEIIAINGSNVSNQAMQDAMKESGTIAMLVRPKRM